MNELSGQPLFRREAIEASRRLHGEVVLTQSVSTWLYVAAIAIIAGIATLWLTLGTYSRIESAPGILVTSEASTKIQIPVLGRVSQLRVAEGSLVRRGDTLAVIDIDRTSPEGGGSAESSIATIENRIKIANQQLGLAEHQSSAQRERLERMIATTDSQGAALRRQIVLQNQVLTSARGLLERLERVVATGFVSEVEHQRRRQAVLNAEQTLNQLDLQLIGLEGNHADARTELAELPIQTEREKTTLRSSIEGLLQERSRLRGEQAYLVTAPIAGRVAAMQTAAGRMVTSTAPLMTIVPENATLKAQIYAPSRAIGLVRARQEVRLLFDSFPYQRFGSFGGRVTSISRVVIDPRESNSPLALQEPYYAIEAELASQTVTAFGEPVPLQPGMTLQANIVLERQSFLDWLLSPLHVLLRRS